MNAKSFSAVALLMMSATAILIACNKGGGGDAGAPTAPVAAIAPVGCGGSPCPLPASPTVNFYALKDASQIYGYAGANQNPTQLSIYSPFKDLLKNIMGVCDRMDNTGGIYACTSWQSGSHQIIITIPTTTSTTATLMIKSLPSSSNSYSYYGYQFPDAKEFFLNILGFPTAMNVQGYYNPLILNLTVWPQGSGVEFRIESPPTLSKGGAIQIITTNKLEDPTMNFDLYYQAQKAASGKMVKY